MLPYAAYLRVYEPLTAFREPERAHWAAYVAPVRSTRRVNGLEAEHDEAMRRLIAVPPIIAPAQESEHAYVRRADGVIYVCPWQTRLRSWLALGRLRATLPPAMADTFVPRQLADLAAADFARWHSRSSSIRTHILTATWHVPLAWFVPFGPPERWLVLGGAVAGDGGPATAAATRTLVYVTTMAQAQRRVARALGAVRRGLSRASHPYDGGTPPFVSGADTADGAGGADGSDGSAGADDVDGAHGRASGAAPTAGTAPPGAMPRRARGRHAGKARDDDAVRRADSPRHGGAPGHDEISRRADARRHSDLPGDREVPRHKDARRHGGVPRDADTPHEDARRHGGVARHEETPHADARRRPAAPRHGGGPAPADPSPLAAALSGGAAPAALWEIEEVGRWLEEFHPRALVELDYGGLVHLIDDEALRADQSVAEVAAAVTGLETGELELAIAMYERLRTRWRALRGVEFGN